MLSTDPAILQVAYLPGGGFVLPILGRLQSSTVEHVRALAQPWSTSGLGDLSCSLSTKLAMLALLGEQLNASVDALFKEIENDPRARVALEERRTWPPAQRNQPYRVLLALDAFIFELRSASEILGKFLVRFASSILDRKLSESEVTAELERRGLNMAWATALREHRKLLFHEQAPWLAVRIVSWQPFKPELLMLTHAGADPGDAEKTLSVEQLREMYRGMAAAINQIQDWLLSEIAALESQRR